MTGVDSGNHAAKSEREEAMTRRKKTPERFLVPGPFRSAGAFIEIAVDLMPTSFFPSFAWLSSCCNLVWQVACRKQKSGAGPTDSRFNAGKPSNCDQRECSKSDRPIASSINSTAARVALNTFPRSQSRGRRGLPQQIPVAHAVGQRDAIAAVFVDHVRKREASPG